MKTTSAKTIALYNHIKTPVIELQLTADGLQLWHNILNIMAPWNPNSSKAYNTFKIPKANGKTRIIEEPKPQLKFIQRALLPLLQQLPRSPYVYGLGGINDAVSNGYYHVDSKVIVKMDVKAFFPSTTLTHYWKALDANKGISDELFALLEHAASFMFIEKIKGEIRLPTGAPTSPLVSSICFGTADIELQAIAWMMDMGYTRYMDDLTFSGNKYPPGLQKAVNAIIEKHGYKTNHKKSVVLYRDNHPQIVTGVGVNSTPGVGKAYKRKLRAELDTYARQGTSLGPLMLGKLNYVGMVNHLQKVKFLNYFEKRKQRWKEIHDQSSYPGPPIS